MILRTYSCGPVSTNAYLLGCDQTRSAILIDAPKNCSSLIIKDLESLGRNRDHNKHENVERLLQYIKSLKPFKVNIKD